MLDTKTVLLIFGIIFLLVAFTRKAIFKQKKQATNTGKATRAPAPVKPLMTEELFNKAWKGLSYLMLLAAVGNGYMFYNSLKGVLETRSYILGIDAICSLAAAVIGVFIWRLHLKSLVIAYMVITVIPIMIFISSGHSADGIIHLFPLMLLYFAVKPVWEYIEGQSQKPPHSG